MRRLPVVGVLVAVLVGVGCEGASPTETDEYKALEASIEELEQEILDLRNPTRVVDQTVYVLAGEYVAWEFDLSVGDVLSVDMDTPDGGTANIWLLTGQVDMDKLAGGDRSFRQDLKYGGPS
jgi:hypothetical protein